MHNTVSQSSGRFPWRTALMVAAAWLLIVGVLQWRNPRLVPSWHGFLHGAIVERMPSGLRVPENPFFAGEPLPYYWVYHWIGAGLALIPGVSSLAALQLMTLVSLAALVMLAMDVGRRLTGSIGAGVLIGFLALAGANPLGPVIAAAHVAGGRDVMSTEAATPPETVFVSDGGADRMMSRPLLGDLYFGSDWRSGQNLAWFWDISSRAPALAALMLLVWSLVRDAARLITVLAMLLVTLLNPLIGVSVAITLGAAVILVSSTRVGDGRPLRAGVMLAGLIGLGVVVASPSFVHLFTYAGAGGLSPPQWVLLKALYLALNYGLVVALAGWACFRPSGQRLGLVRAVFVAGSGLLGLTVVAGLAEGNEHNLANAASILIAVPAGAAPWYGRLRLGRLDVGAGRTALLVGLLHLPMTAGTLLAFDGRPPLPFRYLPQLERTPPEHAISRLYEWIRRETPREAVLVADPDRPIKMSGNVSELPAFTGRALFVDQPSYLTRSHAAFADRTRLARALVRGDVTSSGDSSALESLGRPVYLVTADPSNRSRLEQRHGPALFESGAVSVFRVVPDGVKVRY